MSIAPSGDVVASAAGSHVTQTTGTDVQRGQHNAANHQRQIDSNHQADSAAGIGETDPNHETQQRDADGRRPWGIDPVKRASVQGDASDSAPSTTHDASERCGQSIDLTA